MDFTDLSTEDRHRLLKFVCSFAWADLEVAPAERELFARLIREMDLAPEEREEVEMWLSHPPDPDDVDPQTVPTEHRKIFLHAAMSMVLADGVVAPGEVINYDLFERIVGAPA